MLKVSGNFAEIASAFRKMLTNLLWKQSYDPRCLQAQIKIIIQDIYYEYIHNYFNNFLSGVKVLTEMYILCSNTNFIDGFRRCDLTGKNKILERLILFNFKMCADIFGIFQIVIHQNTG
jgi:hypothetical protein